MQIGLTGMPAAGKTTLFNVLCGSSYPTGIGGGDDTHTGSALVPDQRIDFLSDIYKPKKKVYARIEFKDIPGARMDDSPARAARLLDEVRGADALVQVLRVFSDPVAEAVAGEPDPYSDLLNFESELILADMDSLEKRIGRIEDNPKGKKDAAAQLALLKKLLSALENEERLSNIALDQTEKDLLAGQQFLSEKPVFLLVNLDEKTLKERSYPDRDKIISYSREKNIPMIEVCARAEMEIGELDPAERSLFMNELGIEESGLDLLARTAYESLNLLSFFTVGDDEVRAWTVTRGTDARRAAGKIHSDFEKGFIRAEVFHYDHIRELGSAAKVREAGHFRLEGKEYTVKDGDVISFRFNV